MAADQVTHESPAQSLFECTRDATYSVTQHESTLHAESRTKSA